MAASKLPVTALVKAPSKAATKASAKTPVKAPVQAALEAPTTAAPVFEPVRTRRTFEAVCDQIRRQVADGSLQPGHRLPGERDLAEQFDISRSGVGSTPSRAKTSSRCAARSCSTFAPAMPTGPATRWPRICGSSTITSRPSARRRPRSWRRCPASAASLG
ncbi:MAG: GntR family transcriptional regulator [Betaproteobacteria bacterium]|nr:GntR family transcriptional regulator [Betaproteobacteria bacterium]